MAFGSETYRPNGSLAMNGANKAGIFIEAVTLWYGAKESGSKIFNNIPTGAMFIVIAQAGGQYTPSIGSDGAGHAKLIWTYTPGGGSFLDNTSDTTFLVFAKRVNNTEQFGVSSINDEGDQLYDINFPVPQYAGSVQPGAVASDSSYSQDGIYQRNTHTAIINVRPNTNRLIMVNLPDAATGDDTWYSCIPFLAAGARTYVNGNFSYDIPVDITILRRKGQPYQVPTLHVFSLDGPVSGGAAYGEQIFRANGSLMYDSSAENITIRDQQSFTYPGRGQAIAAMSLNMPARPGVVIPYLRQLIYHSMPTDINGNGGYYAVWVGMVQRRGNQLRYGMLKTEHRLVYGSGGINFDSQSGVPSGGAVMVVDLAQLSPSSVAGSPVHPAYNQ